MTRGHGSGRQGLPHRARTRRRASDDPAILELLDTVREVRTTLAIDLSAAAGALDENHPDVARDILAATCAELEFVDGHVPRSAVDELAPRRRARRSRALIALPAVPIVGAIAMTAAAALSGTSSHHAAGAATQHAIVQHESATSTLQRLEHVVKQHPRAAQVIAVADALHQQLTQMIATSTNDPAQLHVVQQLLTLEQRVLESSRVPGTQLALAASREIADLLKEHPAHPRSKHDISNHNAPATAPTAAPTSRPTSSPKPTPTHTQPVPQSHQSSPTTRKSPSPKPSDGLIGRGVFDRPR